MIVLIVELAERIEVHLWQISRWYYLGFSLKQALDTLQVQKWQGK